MSPILDPNREFINKWEMYKLLLHHSIKNIQIPDTKLFSRESLSSMLIEYPLLYIKPIASGAGKISVPFNKTRTPLFGLFKVKMQSLLMTLMRSIIKLINFTKIKVPLYKEESQQSSLMIVHLI